MKFSDLTAKIDPFFENLYRGNNLHASSVFVEYLTNLKPGFLKAILVKMGLIIPTKCFFKTKYNLNFTPCAMNPFYMYLVELSIWANLQKAEQEKVV